MKKSDILKMKTIGVYTNSAFSGIRVKDFEYGIDDYVLYTSHPDNKVHRTKIYTNGNGESFLKWNGRRVKFSEILRV